MKHRSTSRFLKLLAVFTISLPTIWLVRPQGAQAAILLEEGGRSVKPKSAVKTAEDGHELRRLRRVGIGVSGAGPLGVGGVDLELNFTRDEGFMGGYGGGAGFQAFTLQYKRILGGQNLLPYFAAGYSRWYSSGKGTPISGSTTPSFLGEKFLNENERRTGKFAVDLLYPALGVQYIQATGPWAGSSIFFELIALTDVQDVIMVPTGTLGFVYYF